MTKLGQFCQRICILLVSIFLSILFSELFLNLINYNYTPLRIKLLNKNDWRYYHSFDDKHFIYDPYLVWRPKNNYSVFNSQGYRGKELAIKKRKDEFRIFAIGDSNTLGWDEKDGPNWPLYLDELLNKTDQRYIVVNAGVYGYTSFQGLRRFKEILPFQPDMVLISFGSNDAHMVTVSDDEFNRRTIRKINLDILLHKFKTGQLVIEFFDKILLKKIFPLVHRVNLNEYRNNLNEIIRISKTKGIKIVLLTRPYIGESPDRFYWKNFGLDYNAATIKVAKDNSVPVIDVYSYFRNKEEYFIDECHFSKAGHDEAAKLIYEKIKIYLN